MIHNLAITTPTLGTIRLGDIATNSKGKRYPVRSNHFKITAMYKDTEGRWVEHPMHKKVAETTGQDPEKITEIPVRFMFNTPELNMRARYEAFDRDGRTVCAGDGKCARRRDGEKIVSVDCPGADSCTFGRQAKCDLFARLNVIIEGQDDEFSAFILRTESYNAVKTLEAKMKRMYALFGNRLIGIPFKLKLRQKATSMSMWTKFYYTDLVLNNVSAIEAMKIAKDHEILLEESGLNQANMEQEALNGIENGAFEEGEAEFDELEAFLLARDDDEIPEEQGISTGQDAPDTSIGLTGLREFLGAASDAGALKVPMPQNDHQHQLTA